MKNVLVALTFGLLLVGSHARAGTAQDKYNSLVAKSAAPADYTTVGKTACACLQGTVPAGWVVIGSPIGLDGQIPVACFVPSFRADGSMNGGEFCPSFTALAR